MTTWSVVAALSCTLAGIAALAAGLVANQPLQAVRMALELWLAAGLLRLSTNADWSSLAVVAAVIVVRQLVSRSLPARR